MKKNLIKTTFILLVTSSIAKLCSFFVRIYLARTLNNEAMNYYTLAMPTLLLLITLAQMGIPNALAKVIASSKQADSPLKASILFSLFNNLLLLIFTALLIPLLSNLIFHDHHLIPVLFSCLSMIPLVTLSGLCKGYLLGKQRMLAYSSSQITEEIFRIAFLLVTLPLCNHPVILAKLAIYSMAFGELGSSMHMLLVILFKRKNTFTLFKSKTDKKILFSILEIALPMTFSRLIGSFCFFLEPMVMLINVTQANQTAIINQFTLLNSYVQPMITMPSFVTILISNWALPVFSEAYSRKDKTKMIHIFNLSCSFSLLISVGWAILLFLFPNLICQLIYKQTTMAPLLKQLAIPFSIFGLQPVLSMLIHGFDKSTKAMVDTILGCIVRLFILTFGPLYWDVNAISIALVISMLVTTLLHLYHVLKELFFHHI